MSPLQRAVQDLTSASWGLIAYELGHVPAGELAVALQHFWVMVALFPAANFAGHVLRDLGRRALERLARAEGIDIAGARVESDVFRPRPGGVVS